MIKSNIVSQEEEFMSPDRFKKIQPELQSACNKFNAEHFGKLHKMFIYNSNTMILKIVVSSGLDNKGRR